MWCIYNSILLSHKKNKIMPREATWVDLETAMLCELSQKEEEKYMILLIQRLLKKMIQMNLFTKQKQTHRLRELVVTREEGWEEGIVREFEMDM